MAWTTPIQRAVAFLVTASVWNTDVVDNLNFLKSEVDTAVERSVGGARHIESGTLGVAAVGQQANRDVSITFTNAYASAPVVVVSSWGSVSPPTPTVLNLTTTGFTFRLINFLSEGQNVDGWWIAEGAD